MTDEELTQRLEAAWKCDLVPFAGEFAGIDAYAVRGGQTVGYVERKTRLHTFGTYSTAILDARKWLGLLSAEFATGLPAILAVGYECGRVAQVRPASHPALVVTIETPGQDSVSLNRGVPRPVVHIPLDAFEAVSK